MSKFKRMHLVVLDSVGIGAAPDANNFVNAGVPDGASDTLGHISKTVGLNVPNMAKIGLGNIPREVPLKTVPAESNPTGYATKLQEVSLGKDTMTGHWEIMGLNITEPFDTFWNGFPEEILTKIEEFSGRKVIREANKPYSGTAVIDDFGPRQMETGELIIYTSFLWMNSTVSANTLVPSLWNVQLFLVESLPALMLENLETLHVQPTVVTWLFHHLRQLFWTS